MKQITGSSSQALSVLAVVISIATLLIVLYQLWLAQSVKQEQRASALPYVEILSEEPALESFSLSLVNRGVGTALIDEITLIVDGRMYVEEDPYLFFQPVSSPDTVVFDYADVLPSRRIAARAQVEVISTTEAARVSVLRDWFGTGGNIKLVVAYSSVYGDRWVTEGIGASPRLIAGDAE